MGMPDFVIRDADGDTLLLVEAKSRRGMTEEWAASQRRNYLAHFGIGAPFLLATPDRFFWWVSKSQSAEAVPPEYTIDAQDVIRNYASHAGTGMLSPSVFESTVSLWLRELISGLADPSVLPEPLRDRSFLDRLSSSVVV